MKAFSETKIITPVYETSLLTITSRRFDSLSCALSSHLCSGKSACLFKLVRVKFFYVSFVSLITKFSFLSLFFVCLITSDIHLFIVYLFI